MGRKSKDEVTIGKMAGITDDEALSRFKPGRGAELIPAAEIEAKLAELNARVTKAQEDGAKGALSSSQILNAGDEKILQGQLRENKRIVEALVGHLVQHVVMSTMIEGALAAAQKDIKQRAAHVGAEHLKLIQRMIKMGLKAEDCRVSDGDLKVFVELLKTRGTSIVRNLLPFPDQRQRHTDETLAASEEEAAAIRAESGARTKHEPPPYVEPPYEREAPTDYAEPWNRELGPTPRDFWSIDFKIPTGYFWEASENEDPAMEVVRDMPLPAHDEWDGLREIDASFGLVTKPGMMSRGSGEVRLRTFFGALRFIKEENVPDVWIRAWIFLLWARHAPTEEIERKFGKDYFGGLSIPDPSNGSFAIRTLFAGGG
ncbi:hypothetical protein HZF05_03080 [Sphingomonas sp. CGMCC 1.13654]|uniref:Uncharacterized protein n=1 Tax=Sphingomonas chungangi TaxID=2683589 RepID=A0A838L1L2_9SPHN|nr:hypothetical protein [Sphingomonas chungangi]MBA2933074.1 hypothetical protein [Sphingomonas chungangi]MVW56694.1 hypothetical protein [Sphingomonas chungangi]